MLRVLSPSSAATIVDWHACSLITLRARPAEYLVFRAPRYTKASAAFGLRSKTRGWRLARQVARFRSPDLQQSDPGQTTSLADLSGIYPRGSPNPRTVSKAGPVSLCS